MNKFKIGQELFYIDADGILYKGRPSTITIMNQRIAYNFGMKDAQGNAKYILEAYCYATLEELKRNQKRFQDFFRKNQEIATKANIEIDELFAKNVGVKMTPEFIKETFTVVERAEVTGELKNEGDEETEIVPLSDNADGNKT